MRLAVELYGTIVGAVEGDAGTFDFTPTQAGIERFGANDGRLALAVNRRYRHAEITRDDLIAEFSGWRLRRSSAVVDETLDQLRNLVKNETPLAGAFASLQDHVLGFLDNLRSNEPVGYR